MNQLSGHLVVLGGSGGIGREVVLAGARAGADAISFTYGKNKGAAESLADELSQMGVPSYFASVERLDEEGFKTFLDDAVRTLGKEPSMMVDAIGISPNKHHLEWSVEDLAEVYATNVIGSASALRAVGERMWKAKIAGSIVLITSSNGENSQASYSFGYDISKAAQIHLARTLGEPYAKDGGIRINSVAPGWVDTPMNDTLPPGEKERETAKIWLGRFGRPEEIAKPIIFLLSKDASYVVGQNLLVDGGYR